MVVAAALPSEVINSLSRCRLISRLGNDTDKIAVEAATERGIIVSNAPYFCVAEMANHIMAMLLSLARRLPEMSDYMRTGGLPPSPRGGGAFGTPGGKGPGHNRLRRHRAPMARRALPFGFEVLATRRRMDEPIDPSLSVDLVDLDTLLAPSDFVSLQLPLTPRPCRQRRP